MKKDKTRPQLGQIIQNIQADITGRFGKWTGLSLQITGAGIAGNILVGIGKLVMGALSLSFFTCVSAFYTFGMVMAKCCAMAGILKGEDQKGQHRYYSLAGIILIIASLLYVGYSVRLFFYPATSSYNMYVGIAIATFTFTEIGLNIRGVVRERHNHAPLIHAIKMINLAASIITLTLTQAALLSFASTDHQAQPMANGIIGTITGTSATLIGILMLVRIRKIGRGTYYTFIYRQVKKMLRKQKIDFKFRPVQYISNEGKTQMLYVRAKDDTTEGTFPQAQKAAMTQLQMQLELVDASNFTIKGKAMEENYD